MSRWRVARPFALITGLLGSLGSLGTPGLAVAHGYTHHELSEHSHAASVAHGAEHAAPGQQRGAVLGEPDHDSDHGHPDLAGRIRGRYSVGHVAVLAAEVSVPVATAVVKGSIAISRDVDRPPASLRAPPLNSRAPPALV